MAETQSNTDSTSAWDAISAFFATFITDAIFGEGAMKKSKIARFLWAARKLGVSKPLLRDLEGADDPMEMAQRLLASTRPFDDALTLDDRPALRGALAYIGWKCA